MTQNIQLLEPNQDNSMIFDGDISDASLGITALAMLAIQRIYQRTRILN